MAELELHRGGISGYHGYHALEQFIEFNDRFLGGAFEVPKALKSRNEFIGIESCSADRDLCVLSKLNEAAAEGELSAGDKSYDHAFELVLSVAENKSRSYRLIKRLEV